VRQDPALDVGKDTVAQILARVGREARAQGHLPAVWNQPRRPRRVSAQVLQSDSNDSHCHCPGPTA
jgi:hypothetical protein